MKYIHVVMGNDYPDRAFRRKKDAESYCDQMNAKEKEEELKRDRTHSYNRGRIYYRAFAITLYEAGDK